MLKFQNFLNEKNAEITTSSKLINTAIRDEYITSSEAGSLHIIQSAIEIAKEYDILTKEQKVILRDLYYNKFLKKIKKIK